jgi:tetratricopeptide (TPR) repeat protein
MAHANRALVAASNPKNEKAGTYISSALLLPQDNLTQAEKIIRRMLVQIQTNRKTLSKNDMSSSSSVDGNSATASTIKTDKSKMKATSLKPLCDELINAYPNNTGAYEVAIAACRFVDDNPDQAFAYTEKLIDINPTYAPAWNTLGYHWMEKGNMDKAAEAFKNYMRLAPDEANAHDSMGDYLMKANRFEEAANHYDKAVSLGMTGSRERAEKARNMARIPETDDLPDK